MTELCRDCNAEHFASKYKNDEQLTECCHKEQFILRKNPPYPGEIKNSATDMTEDSMEFGRNIRLYNNARAFSRFKDNFEMLSGKGSKVVRICEQVYRNTYASL